MPTRSQRPPDPHPHAWSQVVRWGAVGVTIAIGLSQRVGGVTGETIDVVTDATGQYRVAGFQREYAIVSARPQGQYLSPCKGIRMLWCCRGQSRNALAAECDPSLKHRSNTSMAPTATTSCAVVGTTMVNRCACARTDTARPIESFGPPGPIS
jgi:hypothetical protein